jgi:hypothetical protein
MPEMNDDRVADLVEEQLRYLRGEGPRPDLTGLTDDERADIREVLDVVDALADSLPASPLIEEDPVAVRLGLVDRWRSPSPGPLSDPVVVSAGELADRFGGAVEVEAAPAPAGDPGMWRPTLVCRSLAEMALVVVYDADALIPTAADARALFHDHPRLSAVAFTTPDATAAAVVVPSDSVDRLIPTEGWQTPEELTWEPLGLALGRHFDRSMPRWDEVTSLPPGDLLEDLADEAGGIVAEKLRDVASTRPWLPHKRHARDFVSALDPGAFLAWVDAVRARRASGEELVSQVGELCREETP